jgi:hypothetical protein
MDEERNKRRVSLQNKYEFLLSDSMQGGSMASGFACGDGWMSILEDLFVKIGDEVKNANLVGFKVVQVKEKFGDLVVCVHRGDDVIDALIRAASIKAARTCEECGKPGRKREFNEWYRTQCSICYAEQPACVR